MAKSNKRSARQKKQQDSEVFERLNRFLQKYQKQIFIASAGLTLLFSFLLFNFNVSLMGDDGAYIKRAYRLLHDGDFPTFQGPLYPIVLSFFIWLAGLNVTFLKALSGIFILGHLYFFYRAFKDRIPALLYIFTLIILGTNAYLVSYSSWTFSEALFLMLQAWLFYYLLRHVWEERLKSNRERIMKFLVLGLLLILLAKTRSVGYGAVVAVVIFFAFTRQWRSIGYTLGSFGLFYLVFRGVRSIFFGVSSNAQFGSQFNRLLLKDPYNPGKGKEDLVGFVERFWNNSELYLSKHTYKFLGLRPDDVVQTSTVLTVVAYILFGLALFYAFRKNKYLLFTGVYIAVMSAVTFFILQTRWDQDRLILVFFPLIVPFLLSGLYYLGKDKLPLFRFILPGLLVVLIFSNLGRTFNKVDLHQDKFIHHLQGDDLYGLTPDWVNYVKMARFAAENIPDNVNIACRKPNIAFIKAQREFYGIHRVNTQDADKLLQKLAQNDVRYVIMASLRKYPSRKTKYTINTVKRYLYYIQQKYPKAIELVHRIGQDEQAYLFRINYNAVGDGKVGDDQ